MIDDLRYRWSQRFGPRGPASPDRRPWVAALVIGVAAGYMGLRVSDALLVGLAALAVGLVWVSLRSGGVESWPAAELGQTDGTRGEISALTWSFTGRDGRTTEAGVRRLREVAVRRLARSGVPGVVLTGRAAADPAQQERREQARALLGERAWAALTGAGGLLPSLRDIEHCVDVLERLGTTPQERLHP